MADTEIEQLTGAAIDARSRGAEAEAAELFQQRDGLAKELYPEGRDGETASPAPSGTAAEAVSAGVLDQIRDILVSTGDTGMADATLPSTVEYALNFAQEFDRQHPIVANEIAELASSDARIYAMVLEFAAAQGRQAPKAAAPAPRSNPDRTYTPTEPILTRHESVQSDLDAMIAQHPPGSHGYTDRKFQARLQALYAQLDDGPMIGRSGRNY